MEISFTNSVSMTVSAVQIGTGGQINGCSDWTEQVRAIIAGVAPYRTNVMISGASGTGKELIARAMHDESPRVAKRFVPVDCTSLTGPLFASHMFGHVKGSFTGATHNSIGCFRAADGGTIFLDEIGDMELELQAKLLRVLQERVVTPLGSHEGIAVDVRIVAATNRDLQAEVAAGRFREDLYYRLNVVSVHTLPLRERPDDIELLANHFLTRFTVENGIPLRHLAPAALAKLRRYPWPGNVRELQNAIERAMLFSKGAELGPELFPAIAPPVAPKISDFTSSIPTDKANESFQESFRASDRWLTAAEVESAHIARTLQRTGYNQSAAARLLGIDRHQLRRRMERYGLKGPQPQDVMPAKKRAA